jgi:hypothetical protein
MLSRLLILSLLIATYGAPVAAQSSSDKISLSSWSPQNGFIPPQECRLHFPALTQNAQADQVQPPFHWDAPNLSHATPVNPTPFLSPKFGNRSVTLAQNAAPCYSIRSYRFTREDPRSDSTKICGLLHVPSRN